MTGSRFTSALLLALAGLAHAETPLPDDICSRPPPPGTGLAADGRGIIHIHKAGFYEFYGVRTNRTGPTWYAEGGWASVLAVTSSRIEWLRPDGRREVIPTDRMYPPF